MTTPDPSFRAEVARAAIDAAETMRSLSPGAMAELRRMDADSPAPAFWQIAVRHPVMTRSAATRANWVGILRLLAILTPRGESEGERPPLHDPKRPLGQFFYDGGDPDRKEEDGVISERRLALLLATRGRARLPALTRAIRMVATKRPISSGVDVAQIVRAVLWPGATAEIGEAYYRSLDRANRLQSKENSK